MKQPRTDDKGAGYGHFCKSTLESPWVEKIGHCMWLNMLWKKIKKYGVILFLLIYFFPMFSDIDSLPCWCWTTSSETLLSSSAKDVPDLWPGRQKVFGETVVKQCQTCRGCWSNRPGFSRTAAFWTPCKAVRDTENSWIFDLWRAIDVKPRNTCDTGVNDLNAVTKRDFAPCCSASPSISFWTTCINLYYSVST